MGCGFRSILMILHKRNAIKLVQVDGEVVKIKGPKKVKEVLQEYPNYGIYECDAFRHLGRRASPLEETVDLKPGQFYCLAAVNHEDECNISESRAEGHKSNYKIIKEPSLRLRIIVPKEELASLLSESKDKVEFIEKITLMASLKTIRVEESAGSTSNNYSRSSVIWRPSLETIPENI